MITVFVIDGIDYTFHIFGIVFIIISVILFFTVQYLLCSRAKKTRTKLIPAYGVVLQIVLAIFVTLSDNHGSFLDLRSFVALVILCYALICAISAMVAWVIFSAKNKRRNSSLTDR